MNILILNWRDPKNTKAGGAEKLNMNILRPLVAEGNCVTWYAMAQKNLPSTEMIEGVKIVRFGNPLTHLLAWPFFYWTGKLGNPDYIIDSIHGTGYLSSLIAPRKNKIILICEVAQNIWDEMYPFPINTLGKVWEKIMFHLYNNQKFWTISESTKQDLIHFGIVKDNIDVIPMGFDAVTLKNTPPKFTDPTALFVGRLAEMKGIKDAIKAIAKVNESSETKWNLNIIGRGEAQYEKHLRKLVAEYGQEKHIAFRGFVTEKEKFEEMAKAWILLVPSSREGWGMIVPEANSVGTPAIGYNVPGLKNVLQKYSRKNRLIEPSYTKMVKEILSISRPTVITDKPTSGWSDLYTYISERIY